MNKSWTLFEQTSDAKVHRREESRYFRYTCFKLKVNFYYTSI